MNKTTPRAKFIRGFLIAIGPTLVWATTLDYAHLSRSDITVIGLGIIVALVTGIFAAALAWGQLLQGGGPFARAGAQALEQFVAGAGVLVLTDLSGHAVIVYAFAIVTIGGQAIAGGVAAYVLNLLEGPQATALPAPSQ